MRLLVAALLLVLVATVRGQMGGDALSPSAAQELSLSYDVYALEPIMRAVAEVELFSDSKTYVDMPLMHDVPSTLAAFQQLPRLANGSVDRDVLGSFVSSHFAPAGSDLDRFNYSDFKAQPPNFLPLVTNETIREWGLDVNDLWNLLLRQEGPAFYEDTRKHSLLAFPYPAVIAGDRFREIYYWDSYFIIRGLLVSGMPATARGLAANLASLAADFGLVPNGARSYYVNRSQPPLLSAMVRAVYEATNDTSLLAEAYTGLLAEHAYWTQAPVQVTVAGADGRSHKLARYWSTLRTPRAESYREDVATAAGLAPEQQAQLWNDLAAGAASGWDFSSRWFADGRTLRTCRASRVLPADLNAFLYQMEENLADFTAILATLGSDDSQEAVFRQAAAARKEAINALLWNATAGHWQDLVIDAISDDSEVTAFSPQTRTYASNWVPLWAGLAEPQSAMAAAATKSFTASGLIQAGGVLTSLYNTSQQWDAPNAWPCLQYFMVEGLSAYGDADAQRLAAQLAQTWLESNYVGYLQNGGKMVEKYDGLVPGVDGGGGEYDVQTGFGWTNGVMLHFLQRFGWEPANSLAGSPLILPIDVKANATSS